MPQSIGSLVVRLGLDAAEFTTGLTKSEAEAKRFARQLDDGIALAAKGAGIAIGAIVVAAGAAAAAVDQLAKQASKFKDLEEITGANAEALASFAVSAGTAGTSMDVIASASVKLTKSLTGVDDESKAAGAALVALGLPVKEFKALKPEEQIEAVAKALGGFEDGASKTAVAVALFGKAGAELLPFLKQLNEDGGRQVILTQAQIEAADRYADSQARLKTQISLYAQSIVGEALPVLELFVRALRESLAGTNDLASTVKSFTADGTFRAWFEDVARAVARAADVIVDWANALKLTFGLVDAAGEQIRGLAIQFRGLSRIATGDITGGMDDMRAGFDRMTSAGGKWVASLREAANRTSILTTLNRKLADESQRSVEDRGFTPKRAALKFDGAVKDDKGGRAERQSDAERYLATLNKQLEATFELSAVEKVTLDIMSGRLKLSNGITEQQLLDVAQAIDNAKAEAEARKELARTLQEEARAREQAGKINRQHEEAAIKERDRIIEANQALRDEIVIITGGEEARRAIEKARLSSAIALKEDTAAQLENAGASQIEIDAIHAQIAALKERQGLLSQRDFAVQLAEDAQKIKDINQQFADSFSNAFQDVANGTKTVKEAFKQLEKDIVAIINRLAAQKIAEQLFGGQKGGGTFDFGSIIQSWFGGGSSSSFSGGGGMFGGGGASGGWFADGGMPPVGKVSMVGEEGRELFVPRTAGTILPNNITESLLRGRGGNTVNVFVPAGTGRPTADQIALKTGRQVRRASARIG